MPWIVPGYQHTRELGSGASGRVVLAVHEATGTPVAVKYLGEELRTDPDFLAEFRAEARLLGELASPYVVRLYEYVEGPDGAAIVMELVDGIALRALLRQAGATGPEAALVVLKGSLLGLAAAHERGVVHRDYKPENVLVAADGSSKLVDFGIAVPSGGDGGIAGTPPYMAPEQWSGLPASPAGDVYAATATFFECLTGSRPYNGATFAELVVQHTTAPIPDELAPEAVRPLIRRGLAKEAAQRPESAAAFVAELEVVAGAAYGPDWEERGQRKLAALAALLPLLFPSAGGIPGSSTALATTVLGAGLSRPWMRHLLRHRVLWAVVAGVVAICVLSAVASGAVGGHHHDNHASGGATPTVVTSVTAGPSDGTGPSAGPSPSASASAGATASASASASASTTASAGATSGSPSSGPSATTSTPSTPPATSASAPPATSQPPASATPTPTPTPTPTASPPRATQVVSLRMGEFSVTQAADGYTGTVTVVITTDGTGEVTVNADWFANTDKAPGGQTERQSVVREGSTQYTVTLTHTFSSSLCGLYLGVQVGTAPAAPQSPSSSAYEGCPIR
ncbi:serine/threonine-protein kinase [Peterkaempfera sp. SMS 1(5)a]|uniref:serine/threonine-protein kinase n=1 Tax=Peterkaempfera podocarpi TaxID=3232308 RepID=UPI0036735603